MDRRILGAIALVAGAAAAADATWLRFDGPFGAKLLLTDRVETIEAELAKTKLDDGPGDLVVDLGRPTLGVGTSGPDGSTSSIGVPVRAVVLFTGCAAGEQGTCDVTVRFTFHSADGTTDAKDECEVWRGKPPDEERPVLAGRCVAGILLGLGDSAGEYRVRAEVVDKVAGRKIVLERTFRAVGSAGAG